MTYPHAESVANKNQPGGYIGADLSGRVAAGQLPLATQQDALFRRAGAIAETFSRAGASTTNGGGLVSGQMTLCAIPLLKGAVVSKITFVAGNPGATTPTNQWFGLWSAALAQLAVTADDTTTAWGANQEKQLTLTAPYTVLADGLFYLSCMVAAATVPNLTLIANSGGIANSAPILCARDTTHAGLTNPASAPTNAALATNLTVQPYAWVA